MILFLSLPIMAQEMPEIVVSPRYDQLLIKKCDRSVLNALSRMKPSLEEWREILTVFVVDEITHKPISSLPLLGGYSIDQHHIKFVPRFRLSNGLHYLIRFNIPYFYTIVQEKIPDNKYLQIIEEIIIVPDALFAEKNKVLNIFPSTDTLPVNQLKLYIHFSQEMRPGRAYGNIHFFDSSGQVVDQPFLEVSPELWDRKNKRITLLFDPGRIKRGLTPNQLKGLPLQPNKTYTIKIQDSWLDASGNKLDTVYLKKIVVSGADRTSPKIRKWQLQYPEKHSKNPLIIYFDEIMDEALARRMIMVTSKSGKVIEGEIRLLNEEKIWEFIPNNHWNDDGYEISINSNIEDLAGNSIRRLFDSENPDASLFSTKSTEIIIPIILSKKRKTKKVRKYHLRTP